VIGDDSYNDWEEWRKTTEFYPIEKFSELALLDDVLLPANGSFYVIANNIDEIKWFLGKLECRQRWMASQILIDPFGDDFEWEEGEVEASEERVVRTMRYNQFYKPHERLQLESNEQEVDVSEIIFDEDFLKHLKFPCLVQNSGDSDSDRRGQFEVNHCQVLNLEGVSLREGPIKIHLCWI